MKVLPLKNKKYLDLIQEFKSWLVSQNYSPVTVDAYTNQIKEFLYYLHTEEKVKDVSRLEPIHVLNFHEALKERENTRFSGGLSASHINGISKTVHQFLKFLRQTRKIEVYAALETIKDKKKQPDILSIEEIFQLLESIDTKHYYINYRTKAIIGIFYGAGLRKSELEFLKLEDINFKEQFIHVRHGKGRKERIVPVPMKVIRFIQDYIDHCRDLLEGASENPEDYLFIEVTGNKMSEDAIYKAVGDAVENSGMKDLKAKRITPHTFRHSYASHLLEKGMDIEDIARLLGHSSLDSTMIYTHIKFRK
jgi:site-specific recombinase XerD